MATSATYTAYDTHKFAPGYVFGAELGGLVQAQRTHWALQISALYAQKGFLLQETYQPAGQPPGTSNQIKETYRLNYLTLPINVAYIQHANGQGFQVFAGGYAGLLLNGHWKSDDEFSTPQPNGDIYTAMTIDRERPIKPSSKHPQLTGAKMVEVYSRRIDAGVQAGVGYSYAHLLVQGSYSLGLSNLAPTYLAGTLIDASSGPKSYKNRTAQLSIAYLFGGN